MVHTQHMDRARHSTMLTLIESAQHSTMSLSRGKGRETGGARYRRRCIGAVLAAQQLTGGAVPPPRPRPPPLFPRAQPVRAPHPSSLSSPLIHYLRTVDRFQARSLCLPLHDDRSNLMPFLCPASNTIRLRTPSLLLSSDSDYNIMLNPVYLEQQRITKM